jgi:hypothetical protein
MKISDDFQFGNGKVCCNKPVGCTMTHAGCKWLKHPWKRANVFGDGTVQCQATSYPPDPGTGQPRRMNCVLPASHGLYNHEMEWAEDQP